MAGEEGGPLLKVRDFMSLNPLTINEDASVVDVAKKMAEKGVGSCFIERDGKVVGIVTERDIVRRVVAESREPLRVKASEIMSRPIVAVEPDTSIEDAVRVMAEKKIRRLAVIERNTLVGIITIADLAKALTIKSDIMGGFVRAITRRPPMYG